MSQHSDLSCRAFGCCEPRGAIDAEFCVNHERELRAFWNWLEGVGKRCWPTNRSFDAERNLWSSGQQSA